jgi:hypothetical protein
MCQISERVGETTKPHPGHSKPMDNMDNIDNMDTWTLDLVFFEKKIEFFERFCFSNFSKNGPPKNSKKNYLIFDTIWLQFG